MDISGINFNVFKLEDALKYNEELFKEKKKKKSNKKELSDKLDNKSESKDDGYLVIG